MPKKTAPKKMPILKKYEDSPEDKNEDMKNAKKAGMSAVAYEKSGKDKTADNEGQKRFEKRKRPTIIVGLMGAKKK